MRAHVRESPTRGGSPGAVLHRAGDIIDLELFARISSLLSMLSGAETRVGFHNYRGEGLYRGEHLTHRVHYNPYQHMSQNFMALGEALDGPHEIPTPKRRLAPQAPPVKAAAIQPVAFEYVKNELRRCYPLTDDHRIIVVNHDAGDLLPIRSWPRERFVELIPRLLARDERRGGRPAGHRRGGRVRARHRRTRRRSPLHRLRRADAHAGGRGELFHQSDLLVTNDSGPAHFASLTGIKSITLFGPETPVLYGNMGDDAVHLFAQLACSPCPERAQPPGERVHGQQVSPGDRRRRRPGGGRALPGLAIVARHDGQSRPRRRDDGRPRGMTSRARSRRARGSSRPTLRKTSIQVEECRRASRSTRCVRFRRPRTEVFQVWKRLRYGSSRSVMPHASVHLVRKAQSMESRAAARASKMPSMSSMSRGRAASSL